MDSTLMKRASRFGGMFFPHINVSSRFAWTFLCIKCMFDNSKITEKHSTKSEIKTEVKLMSWFSDI